MHERDNVVIVANDGGLPPGTVLPSGLALRDRVPQGHKVALVDVAAGAPVLRYGIPIGYAVKDIRCWMSLVAARRPGPNTGAAQRSGGVQPRACDLSRTTDDWVSLELMNRHLFFIQPGHVTATGF